MIHLVKLVGLLAVAVGLVARTAMIWHSRLGDGSMLLGVIWVLNENSAFWVVQPTLNILPDVMEVHDLVVFKLILIGSHLLLMDLFQSSGPFVRVCKQLQARETRRQVAIFIECRRLD